MRFRLPSEFEWDDVVGVAYKLSESVFDDFKCLSIVGQPMRLLFFARHVSEKLVAFDA